MDDLTHRIREEIQHCRSERSRRPEYPDSLRQKIVALARERRESGAGVHRIAQSLGLSPNTLYAWLREGKTTPGLRAVDVVATRRRASTPRSTPTLITPRGFRIEGLGVQDLVTLLRALA